MTRLQLGGSLLAGISCLLGYNLTAQVNQSARRIATSQTFTSSVPVKVVSDFAGNLYAAGQGIDGGLFVAKFLTNGNTGWTAVYRGAANGNDRPVAVALDTLTNFYVTAVSQVASDDFVTLKFDAAGNPAWTNRLDGVGHGNDTPGAIGVDGAGNVYVAGNTYRSQIATPHGNVDTYTLTVVSYSPNGTQRWRTDTDGTGYLQAHSVCFDPSGRLIVSGMAVVDPNPIAGTDKFILYSYASNTGTKSVVFEGDFANGNGKRGTTALYSSPYGDLLFSDARGGGQSYFTTRSFATNLQSRWAVTNSFPFNSDCTAKGVQSDQSGNVYLFGYNGNLFEPKDLVLFKYDPAGNLQWQKTVQTSSLAVDAGSAMQVDASGAVYLAGIGSRSGLTNEWVTLKLLPNGTNAWTTRFGGYTNANFLPLTLHLDERGQVFVSGTAPGPTGVGTDLLVVKYIPQDGRIWFAGSQLHVRFIVAPNTTYKLQRSANLSDWSTVATLLADEEGAINWSSTLGDGTSALGFFRAVTP